MPQSTFFNAPFFKREVLKYAEEAGPELRHVVLDLLPIPTIDATGLLTLVEVVEALRLRGVDFNAAGRATEWRQWAKARHFDDGLVRLVSDFAPGRARAVSRRNSALGSR